MHYFIAGFLWILAASVNAATQDASQSYQVTASENTFVVTLQSNPTTGYQWAIKKYDQSFLKLTSAEYLAPTNRHLMGAPGQMVFHFAIKKGVVRPKTTAIGFVYQRPWESKAGKAKQVVIHFLP